MEAQAEQVGADAGQQDQNQNQNQNRGGAANDLDPMVFCQMCHLPLNDGGHRIVALGSCGHIFGHSCILRELGPFGPHRVPQCPVCQTTTTRQRIVNVLMDNPAEDVVEGHRQQMDGLRAETQAFRDRVEALTEQLGAERDGAAGE